MTDRSLIKSVAARTVQLEAQAIANLETFIDADFVKAVEAVYQMKGRLVVSGIGKSAVIGMKIVATLNSTGTPAVFMHAADAIHGDLGMIQSDDVVLIISKSGESPEIKVLVPLVKNFKNIVIGMVGNTESFLSKNSDIVLNTTVSQEACPNNLAPTSSTTAQLVMGDAMAVALMELKGFTSEDFAKFHPGGALGKKLYLHVADLYKNNEKPVVGPKDSIKTVILEISKKRLGVTAVLNEAGVLLGIITDGDVRRMLEHHSELGGIVAEDIMTKTPKTIESDVLAVVALDEMRKQDVNQLVVLDRGNYVGIIHLHDLIREGLI